jgi:predicted enzyme related to lactoylglutathione lyase
VEGTNNDERAPNKHYTMNQQIVKVALVVDDYDEAIDFYTNKLNFDLIEDKKMSETKRWVVVSPKGEGEMSLLLAEASNEEQKKSVGYQTGGRVFLFMHTDNFERDYQNLLKHNIKIIREPFVEPWGTVAVFADLYGNLWDLIQPPA